MSSRNRTATQGSLTPLMKDVTPLSYKGTPASPGEDLTTKVYHGVTITAGENCKIIGRIQSWQPDAFTREGIHLYELSNGAFGRPVEYVPGKATGFTVAVTRAEVWDSEMEIAFGFESAFADLIDQTRPFSLQEYWYRGAKAWQQWNYKGCWFTGKNMDAIEANGDGVTKISATLAYVSRQKLQGKGS